MRLSVSFICGLGAALAFSACAPAARWFESESWFGSSFTQADAPSYIPLAAVPAISPSHPSLKELEARKQRLRQKRQNGK